MSKTLVILTGGRIDSIWDGMVDEIVVAKHSTIPDYLKSLSINDLEFNEVCMKDSRGLTNIDRQAILEAIEHSTADKILITHGTHTLTDTVEYLESKLKKQGKTIVFTGAATPLKEFAQSDAPFNLGYALGKLEGLPPGIYYCSNKKTLTRKEIG